jgi:aminoglycoside 3-N-acetyltransferase I
MHTKQLKRGDRDLARALFVLMANVFGEEAETLTDPHLDSLLCQDGFWAIAAFVDDVLVGGITAHTLPMTRVNASELFLYDIAVRSDHQRKGVGRLLVHELRAMAANVGISDVFVLADNEDLHALDFYRALGGQGSAVTMFDLNSKGSD